MQPAYYLLKLRANSLTSPKNWEVGLKGRMTPASSIPLQSKDTALFQRDLNRYIRNFCLFCLMSKDTALFQRDLNLSHEKVTWHLYVERHCPVPKGFK